MKVGDKVTVVSPTPEHVHLLGKVGHLMLFRQGDQIGVRFGEDKNPTDLYFHELVKHIPPISVTYQGGYTRITSCISCGVLALLEDRHSSLPCPDCGDKLIIKTGKWNKDNQKWTVL